MNNTARRITALFATLILFIGLFAGFNIPAQANTVDYVYSGNYIKNWGVREEVATFLSPNAIEFYEDNNVTVAALLSLSGSSSINSVPSSSLYKELQSLMKKNHSHITSYQDTRSQYQHTDCENSGKTSDKISSFYSGKAIGPRWDSGSTWNREHVWPNSKGLGGDDENDIMMLRPTATSENSSRGNTAYGEGVSYYHPNSESGGEHDLRGDVARICLYQYVRWGNTNRMWGSSGVIESKAVLLKWMEEDPVDTWELGRNDSVESITGTRNVFVDYPELAFALFDAEIPEDYQTPSGSTQQKFVITVISNDNTLGTVSLSDDVIVPAPAKGCRVAGYEIVSGAGRVTALGDTFKVYPQSDVTVCIEFEKIPSYSLTLIANGKTFKTASVQSGDKYTLPKADGEKDYTFVGWTEKETEKTTSKPDYINSGTSISVSKNTTLFALYSVTEEGSNYYLTDIPNECAHENAFEKQEIPPTCTDIGWEAGVYCPDCETYISGGQDIRETGHSYTNSCDNECDVCGFKRAEEPTHNFDVRDICMDCGYSKDEESTDTDVSEEASADTSVPQDESGDVSVPDNTSNDLSTGDTSVAPQENDRNDLWIIFVAVAVVVAIVVVIFIIIKRKNKK